MASNFYNLQQVAAMLRTNRMTLRKWLHEEGIQTRVNPGNEKERQLSWEQITFLAAAHGRILPANPPPPATDPLAALRADLARLERRVNSLEQRLADNEQPTTKMPAVPRQPSLSLAPQQPAEQAPSMPLDHDGKVGFLVRHGVLYTSASRWRPLPAEEAALLAYARGRGQHLHRCTERCRFCEGLPER